MAGVSQAKLMQQSAKIQNNSLPKDAPKLAELTEAPEMAVVVNRNTDKFLNGPDDPFRGNDNNRRVAQRIATEEKRTIPGITTEARNERVKVGAAEGLPKADPANPTVEKAALQQQDASAGQMTGGAVTDASKVANAPHVPSVGETVGTGQAVHAEAPKDAKGDTPKPIWKANSQV